MNWLVFEVKGQGHSETNYDILKVMNSNVTDNVSSIDILVDSIVLCRWSSVYTICQVKKSDNNKATMYGKPAVSL